MSAISSDNAEGLERTTNIVAGSSDYTALLWYKHNSVPVAGKGFTVVGVRNNAYTRWASIFIGLGNNLASLNVENGVSNLATATTTLTQGVWYPVAYVRQGTAHRFYVNGVLIGSVTLDFSAVTLERVELLNDFQAGSDNSTTEGGYFREYSRALTLAEINAELSSPTAVSTTNLVASTPLQANGNDDSGAGNNWSAVGAISYQATTPLQNTSSSTATDIGSVLPYNTTQNVVDGGGTAQTVWYKYTGVAGDKTIGAWFFGDLSVYMPETEVKSPNDATQYINFSGSTNLRIQLPVDEGVTYFFKIIPNGNPSPAVLTVNIERGPQVAYPAGSLVVPQDIVGHPLVIISPSVDYSVLNWVKNFPNSESADIVDNGNILTDDLDDSQVKLFDSNFSLITNLGISIGGALSGRIRTNKATQKFWMINGANPAVARKINSDTGAVEQTETLTGFSGADSIAANNADTILYVSDGNSGSPVKRWDAVGDAFLSDLAAGIAFYFCAVDLLVLEDDSILVLYYRTAFGVIDVMVKRFDPAGATLNTYNFGSDFRFPGGTPPRIAYALDSPNSFWLWQHVLSNVGQSKFHNVKVSDGSILGDVLHQEYEDGVYVETPTATPRAKFGIPFSCPFFVATQDSSTGTIIVEKVTIPADSTLFDINASGGAISPTSYQLSNGGTRTHSGLAAGTYSITEDANALYDTVITCSDGSPNTAIALAAGETITVTIVNTLKSVANAKIFVLKMTDPLNTAFLFSFTGTGVTPTSWVLHSEEVIEFNVAPGTYAIIEQAYPQFKTTYMIDNDPLNNNLAIVVAANEEVSVGVLNEAFGGGLFFPNPTFPGAPYPPGTGQPFDKVPDQNQGTVNTQIPTPFAESAFVRDI